VLPLPPHDVSASVDANNTAIAVPTALREEDFRANPPTIIPIADAHKTIGVHGFRFCALGRIAELPRPAVLIVSVTFCVPLAPVAIGDEEQVAPTGSPLQEKFTAFGNVVAPTGVTNKL
jgi:hypothetical protein